VWSGSAHGERDRASDHGQLTAAAQWTRHGPRLTTHHRAQRGDGARGTGDYRTPLPRGGFVADTEQRGQLAAPGWSATRQCSHGGGRRPVFSAAPDGSELLDEVCGSSCASIDSSAWTFEPRVGLAARARAAGRCALRATRHSTTRAQPTIRIQSNNESGNVRPFVASGGCGSAGSCQIHAPELFAFSHARSAHPFTPRPPHAPLLFSVLLLSPAVSRASRIRRHRRPTCRAASQGRLPRRCKRA